MLFANSVRFLTKGAKMAISVGDKVVVNDVEGVVSVVSDQLIVSFPNGTLAVDIDQAVPVVVKDVTVTASKTALTE